MTLGELGGEHRGRVKCFCRCEKYAGGAVGDFFRPLRPASIIREVADRVIRLLLECHQLVDEVFLIAEFLFVLRLFRSGIEVIPRRKSADWNACGGERRKRLVCGV